MKIENAVPGKSPRPRKKTVTLYLDHDVLSWLKKDGDGYEARVNQIFRERMLEELKQA